MNINRAISYGHAVQSFSNAMYGFFTVIIAEVFFNGSSNEFVKMLASYGTYAAGYFAMPIGALIFGMFGDKYGRKLMILISTFCTGVAVLSIGCLPSYASIGIVAPILLTIIRLLQGLCNSAEYSGVFVYNYEVSENKAKVGASNAWLLSCGVIGACFAAIIGSVISNKYMFEGGWRIPFILGGTATIIVFILRRKIEEAHDYKEAKVAKSLSQSPYRDLIKNHKIELITGVFLSAFGLMAYCMSVIYGSKLLQECGLSFQKSMLLCIPVMIYFAIAIFFIGKFSDKIGIEKQVIFGLIAMSVTTPVLFALTENISIIRAYVYMLSMITISAITSSSCNALIAQYFPVSCRYSGMSVCDAFGALLGSCSLFASLYLQKTFHSRIASSIWILTIVIPALIGCIMCKRKRIVNA